jgi:hypothetical protein
LAFGKDHFGTEWAGDDMAVVLEGKALPVFYRDLDLSGLHPIHLMIVPRKSDIGWDSYEPTAQVLKRKTEENLQRYTMILTGQPNVPFKKEKRSKCQERRRK